MSSSFIGKNIVVLMKSLQSKNVLRRVFQGEKFSGGEPTWGLFYTPGNFHVHDWFNLRRKRRGVETFD